MGYFTGDLVVTVAIVLGAWFVLTRGEFAGKRERGYGMAAAAGLVVLLLAVMLVLAGPVGEVVAETQELAR